MKESRAYLARIDANPTLDQSKKEQIKIPQDKALSFSIGGWFALGIVLRLAVAYWNSFVAPMYGAEADALAFHEAAVAVANGNASIEYSVGGGNYINFLAYVYRAAWPSLFLGCLVSLAAWIASACVLIATLRLLGVSTHRLQYIVAVYCCLPSAIVFTSVTLREPFQLLAVNIGAYFATKILMNRSEGFSWVGLWLSGVFAAALHGALLAYAVAETVLVLLLRGRAIGNSGRNIFSNAFLLVLVVAVSAIGISYFDDFAYSIQDGIGASIESYQLGAIGQEGRALYRDDAVVSGLGDVAYFLPVALFQYLFEPLPWRVRDVIDGVALFENMLRLLLIASAIRVLLLGRRGRPHLYFGLSAFVILETLWSVGTVNWGTAMRHHLPALGLLLVAHAISGQWRSTISVK